MEFHVIIPARYQSARMPGKALSEIAGKPMIQHVYERAVKSGAASVTVATDDQRIVTAVKNFDGEVCMTAESHRSGTERIAEAAEILGLANNAIVVNIQGDEPLIPPSIISQVANNLRQFKEASMATLCTPLIHSADIFNSNIVKVVFDQNNFALYFSRAPIPWDRDNFDEKKAGPDFAKHYFRHIGIYAYKVGFIQEYLALDVSPLEQIEYLEQLRVLWHGKKIHIDLAVEIPAQDVNTEEDLQKIKKYFK